MAEEDTLKTYWEHFFKAETGTYEVNTSLFSVFNFSNIIKNLQQNTISFWFSLKFRNSVETRRKTSV